MNILLKNGVSENIINGVSLSCENGLRAIFETNIGLITTSPLVNFDKSISEFKTLNSEYKIVEKQTNINNKQSFENCLLLKNGKIFSKIFKIEFSSSDIGFYAVMKTDKGILSTSPITDFSSDYIKTNNSDYVIVKEIQNDLTIM